MKKQKNHFQLKDQENSSEGANNETNFFSLVDRVQKASNENTEGIKKGY